ncbi:MAG TPA: nitrogen regulation protein NR(II) [Gammaproteobacteria bacterium]|nr:nitrogen regulation protein NR(II) [Gammaproteobacteria bacterium]
MNLKSTCEIDKLFEHLSTSLIVVDKYLNIVCVNPAAENLLAMSARRIEEHNVDQLFQGSHEFIQSINNAFDDVYGFSGSGLELFVYSTQKHLKVDAIFTPVPSEAWLIIELTRVDEKLKIEMEDNIVAQQNIMRVLVRGLAHEVKNPLGGIRGAAQLLEGELPDTNLKEYTEVIIGEVDRLQKLVDDLLGPNKPRQKEAVNIHVVLERVRHLVLAESDSALTIIRDYDPSLPELNADQNQLIQAILNIVKNAKQALSGKGSITLRTRSRRNTRIGSSHHRLLAQIEIIDDGPGIDPKMLDQIFFPLVTGRADGTGLGLSISQSLVANHGGLIECSSSPGNTVFTILLPFTN